MTSIVEPEVDRPGEFTREQVEDLAVLLARTVALGNIESLAVSVAGRQALKDAANARQKGGVDYVRRILAYLRSQGKVGPMVRELLQDALPKSQVAHGLREILRGKRVDPDGGSYQAFMRDNEALLNSLSFEEAFARTRRTVCAIGLGGDIGDLVGSGFLIGPDEVLTNYHVIERAVQWVDGTCQQLLPGDQVFCYFDYHARPIPAVPPPRGTLNVASGARDWLLYARDKLTNDGRHTCAILPSREYDYAVIKLSRRVGDLPGRTSGGEPRGWLMLQPTPVDVVTKRRVMLFQHPAREPQLWDFGDFHQEDPTRTRVWYQVTAAHGSSGGATVESDGRLFALHNAEVDQPALGIPLNQGVRIDCIADDLAREKSWTAQPLQFGVDSEFWSLNDAPGDPIPVIGRETFRQNVRIAQDRNSKVRVLTVSGQKDSGVGFSVRVLERVVGRHIPVVQFTIEDMKSTTPRDFVRRIADTLGSPGVGLDVPAPHPTETLARHISNDLPKWLQGRLEESEKRDRTRYPAWVVVPTLATDNRGFLWAENLRDCVVALTGIHEEDQPVIAIPQLRWLFLGGAPDGLPSGGVGRLDDDLDAQVDYDDEFALAAQRAWRSLDLPGPGSVLWFKAQAATERMNARGLPPRKQLAQYLRTVIGNTRAVMEGL
jgi:hypothetical protein